MYLLIYLSIHLLIFIENYHMKKILFILLVSISICTIGYAQVPDEVLEQVEQAGFDQQIIQDKIDSGEISSGELIQAIDNNKIGLEGQTEFIDPAKEQAKEAAEEKAKEKAEEQEDILKEAEKLVREEEVKEEIGIVDDEDEVIIVQEQKEDTYGKGIFRNKTLTLLNQLEDFQAPDNYIVGIGDEFAISIWGDTEYSGEFKVNDEGYIQPPRMPRIYLKGLTHKATIDLIKENFANQYNTRDKDTQIEVVLNYSRLITVGIYGEVFQPGSYKMSALNTAFNALTAAGGPNETGSVRTITVRRSGEPDKVLDVYKYLENPSIIDEFYLEDNDIIHVPTAGKLVRVNGAVKRPMRYEMMPGEGLVDAIDYSGGFGARAYKSNIQIERYGDDEKLLVDVDFKNLLATGQDRELMTGDQIQIYTIEKEYENFVAVEGEVELEGNYELTPGTRVNDIIRKAGIMNNSRTDQAYVVRRDDNLSKKYIPIDINDILNNPASKDNIELQSFDIIRISAKSDFEDNFSYFVEGHVRNPGEFRYDENLKVKDAVFFSRGTIKDAARYAYIQRIDGKDKRRWIRIDLREAVENPESSANKTLLPNDVLVVFPEDRFEDKDVRVEIDGAVRVPGDFAYSPNMTLSDIIYLAGGLREEAAEGRIEVSRIEIDEEKKTQVNIATVRVDRRLVLEGQQGDFKIKPYDQVFVRQAPEFELQQNIQLRGEVVYPGTYTLTDKQETILSVIQRAGGLTDAAFPRGATLIRTEDSLGRVILDLDRAIKNPASRFNYVLKAGDEVSIPRHQDLVSIMGAVRYPNIDTLGKINAPHHKGRRAKFYINKYGTGVDRKMKRGRKNLITVANPNGYVQKTRDYGLFKLYPKVDAGAIVKVDAKPDRKTRREEDGESERRREWSEILSTVVTQATSVLTLLLLADRTLSQ